MKHLLLVALLLLCSCGKPDRSAPITQPAGNSEQIPTWSADDRQFFLYGSMGTEAVPVRVLDAWMEVYPDLFPKPGLAAFGLIVKRPKQPIGFSRGAVSYLGQLDSYGLNCAACHYNEVSTGERSAALPVFGTRGLFNAEAFFGSVAVAMLRTAQPDNMKQFLARYVSQPATLEARWSKQRKAIDAVFARWLKKAGSPTMHPLQPADVAGDAELPQLVGGLLALFDNMRAALHIPHKLPSPAPPISGPGRNDAFGIVSVALFSTPQPYAPVKYGMLWDLDGREWVHSDGNTRSPLLRNLLASLGLGAPLFGDTALLDIALVQRQTDLTQAIKSPSYPWAVDAAAVVRGARHYQDHCASCHEGPEDDTRLYDPKQIGTDLARSRSFDARYARKVNQFFQRVKLAGLERPSSPSVRSTGKYWAASMAGVWARAPYLHNGSVRSIWDLLTPGPRRPKSYRLGSRMYDAEAMGFADRGPFLFDSTTPGNSNSGHDYGTAL
ncbi:hypothetical protein JYT15_00860, partial [Acidimicrobium ferrooxidans]|nr:hypothetical protein [Acidimicrobium ferrooxidans]